MIKLAIDLGTSVTKIYRVGVGIVLSEATCIAVTKETGEIRAFGDEAKRMLGKTAEPSEVVFPLVEGEIQNEELAGRLLSCLLKKVVSRSFFGIEALFCIPCGCTKEEREKYLRVARIAGISRVNFAESPYLVALGQDVPLSDVNPVFAVDVGAGKTSIAAFSLDGMIAGLTMNVGGNMMDIRIIDYVAETFGLKIGALTAEKLKNTVGSLLTNDYQSQIVNGRDTASGRPASLSISSADVLFPIRIYVDKIIEYAELVLKKLPAEVSATVCKSGVYFAGGVCNLAGFAEYVSDRLQMEAHIGQDAQAEVILGGGRVAGSAALLRKIAR